jgi:preprotein translocase subunit YajC
MNTIISTLPLLQEAGNNSMAWVMQIGMIVAIFAVFYFLLIRPQRKKQKEMKAMLEALKKGDRVQTIGGIRGDIVNVKEKTVVIKVDDNTKMEFSRDAVQSILKKGEEEEEAQGS